MLEIKNTVIEMRNAFDGLISRLNTAKERISEIEDITIETSRTQKQTEQTKKKQQNIHGLCNNCKGVT